MGFKLGTLKPCPFCGGEGQGEVAEGEAFIECKECGSRGAAFIYMASSYLDKPDVCSSIDEAMHLSVEAWNNRFYTEEKVEL